MAELDVKVAKHDEAISNLKNRAKENRDRDKRIFTILDEIRKEISGTHTEVKVLGEKLRQRATLYGFFGSLMSVLLVVVAVIVKYSFFP